MNSSTTDFVSCNSRIWKKSAKFQRLRVRVVVIFTLPARIYEYSVRGPLKFEIQTPLGFTVRTSASYWQRLMIKHPDLEGLEDVVRQC